MSLVARNPYTIMRSGPETFTRIGYHDGSSLIGYQASAAFTPGMLVEPHDDSSVNKWRANSSATEICAKFVAVDKPAETDNTGIDDAYAASENAEVVAVHVGAIWYSKLVSGQTAANGALLQPNGNGWLKAATATTQDAQLGWIMCLDNLGTVAADTRCNVMRIV